MRRKRRKVTYDYSDDHKFYFTNGQYNVVRGYNIQFVLHKPIYAIANNATSILSSVAGGFRCRVVAFLLPLPIEVADFGPDAQQPPEVDMWIIALGSNSIHANPVPAVSHLAVTRDFELVKPTEVDPRSYWGIGDQTTAYYGQAFQITATVMSNRITEYLPIDVSGLSIPVKRYGEDFNMTQLFYPRALNGNPSDPGLVGISHVIHAAGFPDSNKRRPIVTSNIEIYDYSLLKIPRWPKP
jgi:hypothetical protein